MKIPSNQNNFGDKVLHANADYSVWNEMGSFEVLYHFSLVVDKEEHGGGTVDWTPQIQLGWATLAARYPYMQL